MSTLISNHHPSTSVKFTGSKLKHEDITYATKRIFNIPDQYIPSPEHTVKSDNTFHSMKWAAKYVTQGFVYPMAKVAYANNRSNKLSQYIRDSKGAATTRTVIKKKIFGSNEEALASAYVNGENNRSTNGHYRISVLGVHQISRTGGILSLPDKNRWEVWTFHTNNQDLANRVSDHVNDNPFGDSNPYVPPSSSSSSPASSSSSLSQNSLAGSAVSNPFGSASLHDHPLENPFTEPTPQQPPPIPDRAKKPSQNPFTDPES